MIGSPWLEVRDLQVAFVDEGRALEVVDRVSFTLNPGETLALVGESGSGKSVTAGSILGLLPQPQGRITGGSIQLEGRDLTRLKSQEMTQVRGSKIAMIFQEPMTALDPVMTIGNQIREVLNLHRQDLTPAQRDQEILNLLRQVELPSPGDRLKSYPFQLSGGMRQRVMIAMALAGNPQLLIADEPTTALDVTVQAQILQLLKKLQKEKNLSLIYITHDMGVVKQIAHRVVVMYAGQVVESGLTQEIFHQPLHPYTQALLACRPGAHHPPKTPLPSIPGQVPSPAEYPRDRCRFAPRCPRAQEACVHSPPDLTPGSREVRCFFPGVHP